MTETLTSVSTLESSETVQVRVRPVPAYRGAVRLAETVTLGGGTVRERNVNCGPTEGERWRHHSLLSTVTSSAAL